MMYRRSTPSMWRDMDRMQREMARLFGEYTPSRLRPAPSFPAMNVWADAEGLRVTAEVPGLRPDDLEISVVGDTLTLSGQRSADNSGEDMRYHRQERGYGRFTRTLQLPMQVDVAKVEASFKNGILQVSLPRAEADKPRKITVKSA